MLRARVQVKPRVSLKPRVCTNTTTQLPKKRENTRVPLKPRVPFKPRVQFKPSLSFLLSKTRTFTYWRCWRRHTRPRPNWLRKALLLLLRLLPSLLLSLPSLLLQLTLLPSLVPVCHSSGKQLCRNSPSILCSFYSFFSISPLFFLSCPLVIQVFSRSARKFKTPSTNSTE